MQFYSKNDPNEPLTGTVANMKAAQAAAPKPEVARKPYQFVQVRLHGCQSITSLLLPVP